MGNTVQAMAAEEFSDVIGKRVVSLTATFDAYMADGFQIKEVLRFFFECVDSLSNIGMHYMDMPIAEQKHQVIAALRKIYDAYNPNLPWITEPFETMVEQALFSYVMPELYTVLLRRKIADHTEAIIAKVKETQPLIP